MLNEIWNVPLDTYPPGILFLAANFRSAQSLIENEPDELVKILTYIDLNTLRLAIHWLYKEKFNKKHKIPGWWGKTFSNETKESIRIYGSYLLAIFNLLSAIDQQRNFVPSKLKADFNYSWYFACSCFELIKNFHAEAKANDNTKKRNACNNYFKESSKSRDKSNPYCPKNQPYLYQIHETGLNMRYFEGATDEHKRIWDSYKQAYRKFNLDKQSRAWGYTYIDIDKNKNREIFFNEGKRKINFCKTYMAQGLENL